MGLFLASAWFGLFENLPFALHLLLMAFFMLAAIRGLRGTGAAWRMPPIEAAARRLETDSGIQHRPYEALAGTPVNNTATVKGLWKRHQADAKAALARLRLSRPQLDLSHDDPWALRYAVIVVVAVAAVSGWGELHSRFAQAFMLAAPSLSLTQKTGPILDAWVTPPAYTKMPPIMLAQGGAGKNNGEVIKIPAGSKIALRVNQSSETPRLHADHAVTDLIAAGEESSSYTFDGEVPRAGTLEVRSGWTRLGRWKVDVVPDEPPQIDWQEPPQVEGQDVVLNFRAHDDYGMAMIEAVVTPAVSTPGLPNEPFAVSLSGVGQKDIEGRARLDLTGNAWAGMPVTLRLSAVDQAGQRTQTAAVTLTLPEREFADPLAKLLVNIRKKLLTDPEGQWNGTANFMAGAAAQPQLYRGDALVFLGLRSAAMRMHLDRFREGLAPVAAVIWQVALRLDTKGLANAQENLRAVQQQLESAIANHESPEKIKELTDKLQGALVEYLSAMAHNLVGKQDMIPEDMMADMGRNLVDDLMQTAQEIQDLAQTGSREAAQQKLEELRQILERLNHASEMTPQQKADLMAMKNLKQMIDEQKRLRDAAPPESKAADTGEEQGGDGGQGMGAGLAERQEKLRAKLGALIDDLAGRHSELPPQLATADQGMKSAVLNLRQEQMTKAKGAQEETVRALEELSKDMKQRMQAQMMIVPGGGRRGQPRDPFGRSAKDDGDSVDDGSVKIPAEQKLQRAREILDELRRRSGEYTRPQEERDYIERLLNQF